MLGTRCFKFKTAYFESYNSVSLSLAQTLAGTCDVSALARARVCVLSSLLYLILNAPSRAPEQVISRRVGRRRL